MSSDEMKALAFAVLVLAFTLPLRADILANGNFADGRAHWKGDAKEIDANANNLTTGNPSGVTVTLKKDKWTKIYQTFNTHAKKVQYSITFTLSPDYQVQQTTYNGSSGNMSGGTAGLDDIEGMPYLYGYSYRGAWLFVVREFGTPGSTYLHPLPDPKKSGSQTLTGNIQGLTDTAEKILVLAFPPGEGSVTLTSISLTPDDQ